MSDWFFDHIGWFLIAFTVVLAGLFGVAIYQDSRAEKFSLRKDSWACTRSHVDTFTTYIKIGDVMVPQFHTDTVCDQWSRR